MPQPFNNAVMTNEGARLLARAQTGEAAIQFTRFVTGNGIYSEEEKTVDALQEQTELKSEKNSYPFTNIEVFSDYGVKVTALITNLDPITGDVLVAQGYYINEMGLYAKLVGETDDKEVLYSITTTSAENGDFMPPYNGHNPVQIIQDYYVTVTNSAEVTIQIGMGAVALVKDLQKVKADVQGQIDGLQDKLNEYFGNPNDADNSDSGIGFVEGIKADNVVDAINEVFQLGNEKKNKLVDNLVAMGVLASTEETWEELLNKVLDMTDTSNDTVTAEVLLEGYTAHNATGELVTGIIPVRASVTVATTGVTQDDSYTYFGVPEGYYDENSKVRAINDDLKLTDAKNVVYLGQVTIGVTGTAQFSAAKINGCENLTNADFLVEIVSGTQKSCSVYVTTDDRVNGIGANIMPFTLNKSYNKNTGVLNVSGFPYARLDASMNGSSKSANAYGNITLKSYAIVPVI